MWIGDGNGDWEAAEKSKAELVLQNSKSKSLNDAFWTFPSHFEWFIAQPLSCERERESMTDRTIPTVSIANCNYMYV